MITPTCPQCQRPVSPDHVDVGQDSALCSVCSVTHSLSRLLKASRLTSGIDLQKPPPGAWLRREDKELIIGAQHRSKDHLPALGLALFWNGIVSVFLVGTFISAIDPDNDVGGGSFILLLLFLAPFVLVGLFIARAALNGMFGITEVQLYGTHGTVVMGYGARRKHQSFDLTKVKEVQVATKDLIEVNKTRRPARIVLASADEPDFEFGTDLTPERRKFVAGALRAALPQFTRKLPT